MKKRIIAVFLVLVMLFSLSSCKGFGETLKDIDKLLGGNVSDETSEPAKKEKETDKTNNTQEPYVDESDSEIYALRNILTKKEKSYYDKFEKEFSDYSLSVLFETDDLDGIERAYEAFIGDHPEYFWLNRGYQTTIKTYVSKTTVTFEPKVFITEGEMRTMKKELDKLTDKIIDEMPPLDDEWEIMLYLHDFIADTAYYARDAAALVREGMSGEQFIPETTAYGCLTEGRAICGGYSAAYTILLHKAGIMAVEVCSDTHAWNCVRLDGKWYNTDITWDDVTPEDPENEEGKIVHVYFMNDDKSFREYDGNHIPSDEYNVFVPECNDSGKGYCQTKGCFLEKYELEGAREIIGAAHKSGIVEIAFGTEEELERARYDLFENGSIFGMTFSDGSVFKDSCSSAVYGRMLIIYTK